MITPRIPSEPSSRRSGLGPAPGARQPAALPGAARGDRPHRLDQVVDVRVERGEVPAGAGRDPAAQGGELERLREVAQRQPVLAELVLERGPERAGLDPRRPRDVVDLEHPVEAAAGRSSPPRRRRRRPAARPRRRRSSRRRTGSPPAAARRTRRAPPRPRARRRDGRPGPAGARSGRESRARRRGRPCRARARRARRGRSGTDAGERRRRLDPRRRQLDRLERHRLLDLRRRRTRAARGRPAPPPRAARG